MTWLRSAQQRIFPTFIGETGSPGKNFDVNAELLCCKRCQETFFVVEHGPAIDRVSAQRTTHPALLRDLAGHCCDTGRIESATQEDATGLTRQPVTNRVP